MTPTPANATDNYASYYWYSGSLSSDGNGSTSYDSSYQNSYSYDSSKSDVHKWDYASSSWVACSNSYCGSPSSSDSAYVSHLTASNSTSDSYWYSSSLSSDGDDTETSYDSSYGNSYSYDDNSDVLKWDYSSSSWVTCSNTYCSSDSNLLTKNSPTVLASKTELNIPQTTRTTGYLTTGLVLASLSVVSLVACKVNSRKGETQDDFIRA